MDEYIGPDELSFEDEDDRRSMGYSMSCSSDETSSPSQSYAVSYYSQISFQDNSLVYEQPMKSKEEDPKQEKSKQSIPRPLFLDPDKARGRATSKVQSNLRQRRQQESSDKNKRTRFDQSLKTNKIELADTAGKQEPDSTNRHSEQTKPLFLRLRPSHSITNTSNRHVSAKDKATSGRRFVSALFWRRKRKKEYGGAFPTLSAIDSAAKSSQRATSKKWFRRTTREMRIATDQEHSNVVTADYANDNREVILFEDKSLPKHSPQSRGCCPTSESFEATPGCMFSLCHGHPEKNDEPIVEYSWPLGNGERKTVATTRAHLHHGSFLYASESVSVREDGGYHDDTASLLAHSVTFNHLYDTRTIKAL